METSNWGQKTPFPMVFLHSRYDECAVHCDFCASVVKIGIFFALSLAEAGAYALAPIIEQEGNDDVQINHNDRRCRTVGRARFR